MLKEVRSPVAAWLTLLALLLAVAAGCPGKPYSSPITFPDKWPTLDTSRYISMYVSISGGSRTPKRAEQVTASCKDASVCKAMVDSKDRWPRLDVVALKAGSTTVAIAYFHPVLKKKFSHEMAVSFVAGSFAQMTLHKDLPAEGQPVHFRGFPDLPPTARVHPLRCERAVPGKGQVSGPPTHDVLLLSCSTPEQKVSGRAHYIACRGICPGADFSRQICVEQKGGKVAAMTFYGREKRGASWVTVKLETRGNPTAGVCQIKGAQDATSGTSASSSGGKAGPDTASSDQPSVTDPVSGTVVAVEAGVLRALARDGKPLWSVDVIKKCGAPATGKAAIRHLAIKGGLVQVTYGKHNFANVGLDSGNITCRGSD